MDSKFIVQFCVAILVLSGSNLAAQTVQRERPGASMGIGAFIYLVDKKACEDTVLPAYRSFTERSDNGPLLKLLRMALSRAPELPSGHGLSARSAESYQHYIDVLEEKRYDDSHSQGESDTLAKPQDLRFLVENSVGPGLVQVFCFPHDLSLRPEQNMSERALMNYLYSQSRWIEDYFTFAKEPSGAVPAIKIGDWSRYFSRTEIQAFNDELAKIPRPTDDPSVQDDFDNLRALVQAAVNNQNFAILLTSM